MASIPPRITLVISFGLIPPPEAKPGLYFCGQITSTTGQLREIGIEAQQIADSAKRYTASW